MVKIMKVVTEVAPKELKELDKIVENGHYLSRSDFVRMAIRNEIHKNNETQKLKLDIQKHKEKTINRLKTEQEEYF